VNIIPERHLKEAAEAHKDAAKEIATWKAVVKGARWRNSEEMKATFKDADPGQILGF
jgi:mRNA-degrading endonuclease HigB of HigAB toxin-antitoxin module